MKCVRPSPEGTWPDSIGRNFTGLGVRRGAIILERINAGPVATTANVNISKTGLKLLAASPTKAANKPFGEYKKLCTLRDHYFNGKVIFHQFSVNQIKSFTYKKREHLK
ncbi:Uncharacterised protein [uncultured archaeon]|nr:Uncharacterised protein [uncultured archaeon]